MYEEHTQHYDKDKIVVPTRRFLCGELTGGLSNQRIADNKLLLRRLNCGFNLMLPRRDEENSLITRRMNTKYRRSKSNESDKEHECSTDTNRLNKSITKRESNERIENDNWKRELRKKMIFRTRQTHYTPESVIRGTRDLN